MVKLHVNSKLSNFSLLNDHVENFIEKISASVYWKDKKGIYLGTNSLFLKVSAMQSHSDIIGMKDSDLLWKDEASIMMQNDQEIIYSKHTKTYIEPAKSPKQVIINYLSHKSPLRSRSGKMIGIIGLSFNIDNEETQCVAFNQIAPFIENPILSKKIKKLAFISRSTFIGLTRRQAHCLYHLIYGLTIKEIAKKLELSPKTVEHYLERIKIKLHCHSRTELIDKALQFLINY